MYQNILNNIISFKKNELYLLKKNKSLSVIRDESEFIFKNISKLNFNKFFYNLKKNFNNNKISIIAEVKKKSPYLGIINNSFNLYKLVSNYENFGATCISIVTDKNFFSGCLNNIFNIKKKFIIPILCKDFIIDIYQIYQIYLSGADAILLIISILDYNYIVDLVSCAQSLNIDIIIEIHSLKELEIALKINTPLIGINNRNLCNFNVNLENSYKLSKYIPKDKILISESGIKNFNDLKYFFKLGIKIFLIGEGFMRFNDPGLELSNMLFNFYN